MENDILTFYFIVHFVLEKLILNEETKIQAMETNGKIPTNSLYIHY